MKRGLLSVFANTFLIILITFYNFHVLQIKQNKEHNVNIVRVEFNPTVPHCSLATLIGLCIRIKLQRNMPYPIKLDIYIKSGAHTTEHESMYIHSHI